MKKEKEFPREVSELIHDIGARQRRSLISTLIGLLVACIIAAFVVFASYTAVRSNLRELSDIKEQKDNWENKTNEAKQKLEDLQVRVNKAELETEQKLEDLQVRVNKAESETEQAKEEADTLKSRVDELEEELKEKTDKLRKATDFGQYSFTADWALTLKNLFGRSRYRHQAELLQDIIDLQDEGVGWRAGGFSPGEGFDSPSFVAYMLEEHGLIDRYIGSGRNVRYRLKEVLPRTAYPGIGDVVFYASGYTMFYFQDENGRPFVMGMTPLGIYALRENFAQIIGYAKIYYPE